MLFGRKLLGVGLAGALLAIGPLPTAQADTSAERSPDPPRAGLLDRLGSIDGLGLVDKGGEQPARPGDSVNAEDNDGGAAPASGPDGLLPGIDRPEVGLVTDPLGPPDSSDPAGPSDPADAPGSAGPEEVDPGSSEPTTASAVHPRAAHPRSAPVVRTVTLVTGDRVRLVYGTDRGPRVRVTPGPHREHVTFDVQREGGNVSVVPSDARALLESDRVDPRLFDVTGLVRQNYHDGGSGGLPLLVQSEPTSRLRPATSARLGLRSLVTPQRLDSVGMVAADLPMDQLADFWGPLEGTIRESENSATASFAHTRPAPVAAPSRGDGERAIDAEIQRPAAEFDVHSMTAPAPWRTLAIEPARVGKLWLDGRVRALGTRQPASDSVIEPDNLLRRVGALTAWRRGLTGNGVRVAVLDSGIDPKHPDLAGRVTESKDFVGGGSMDRMGHGTHVASVIAGSGEASDGTYRGVAPDAELLIGRVLDERGAGAESEVIAGMEWAVRRDADVVNVSLGEETPSDGSDPMSEAANRLGERALIVAAAGNGGPDYRTISAPGAAEHAVTVAAVHQDGQTADFSGRGPRRGDSLAKPDIAAPGVNVVGAKARGTEAGPVVAHRYVELTGTSMAVPYVSGAAAILAQARPDWTPRQLKHALKAAARPHQDRREQGAGELDIARLVQRLGPAEQTSGRRRRLPPRRPE